MGTTGNNVNRAGNYIINVVEKDGDDFIVVKSLFMMDTGSTAKYLDPEYLMRRRFNFQSYDCLNLEQMQFYEDCITCVQQYGKAGDVSAALFIHIPLTAYNAAIETALKSPYLLFPVSFEDSYNPDIWKNGYKDSFGVFHEKVCSSPFDDFVFDVIKEKTDTVVAGHDHVNNFVVNYQGVKFCYSLKSSINSYYDPSMLGGTVITIDSNGETSVEHKLY